ncbi:hypothetical protein [Paraburkholderia sp.]|uniref:hypothetical protein n=1 Tax=Paraburkholderia sp. TaxID=1926495 RepID=UPI00345DF17E
MSGPGMLLHRAIGGHLLVHGGMVFVRNAGHEELTDERRKHDEPHGDQAKPCGQVFAVLELHVVEQKNIAESSLIACQIRGLIQNKNCSPFSLAAVGLRTGSSNRGNELPVRRAVLTPKRAAGNFRRRPDSAYYSACHLQEP